MSNHYLFIILIIIGIFIILIYKNKTNKKEGFNLLYPSYPYFDRRFYNYPTRLFTPTTNIITDLRGDPRYPNFYKYPNYIGEQRYYIHPERLPYNYLWGIPTVYPHFFYYDYWFPAPRFDYTKNYSIDGSLYKTEKIETIPSAKN
jgi:hypothetical protein